MFGYSSTQVVLLIVGIVMGGYVLYSTIHLFVQDAMEDFVKTTTIRLIDTLDTNDAKDANEKNGNSDHQSEQSVVDPTEDE